MIRSTRVKGRIMKRSKTYKVYMSKIGLQRNFQRLIRSQKIRITESNKLVADTPRS